MTICDHCGKPAAHSVKLTIDGHDFKSHIDTCNDCVAALDKHLDDFKPLPGEAMTPPLTREEKVGCSEVLIRTFAKKIKEEPGKQAFVERWADKIIQECDQLLEALKEEDKK